MKYDRLQNQSGRDGSNGTVQVATKHKLLGAGDCGREDCPVCNQGDEMLQNCKKRNILYESSCKLCKWMEEKLEKLTKRLETRERM